ncbi:hypothetical protein [Burkholderia multivorans]|uniref:hypothetical protein n=1 Tax=Burkholderia multivorans TaxID=87883 RepID=UPI0019078491|nr:hypothetical protein [Burkholderia multivorans]MBJ9625408.1 hypothetical protein [Burkholderia multivorans]
MTAIANASPARTDRRLVIVDGLIALYRDDLQLTDTLFGRLPLDTLSIENGARDWPAHERRVLDAPNL